MVLDQAFHRHLRLSGGGTQSGQGSTPAQVEEDDDDLRSRTRGGTAGYHRVDLTSAIGAVLIKKAIKLEKGSPESNKTKVGKISKDKVRAIAEQKMPDLNANDIEAAMKIVAGTARSMGVEVEA